MGKETEFLDACREGNVVKVEHLLATINKKYIVPLFSTTASDLLHTKDARGSTALHLASSNGRKAVVYLLLDEGADVNSKDENGCVPLHLAASNGHLDIAAALISHDPRQETINVTTKNQDTPLHLSAQYGHKNLVSLLLKNGAQISHRNSKGETPLDLAARFGRTEVVRSLLDANPHMVLNALVRDPAEGDAQLPPPFSPLNLAAKNGKIEVVRLLLDSGFDINLVTDEGTALHVAALFGKTDIVKLLLEKGINADARDFHGRTALEMLEEYQTGKSVLLSQLLPNLEAWQHCSSMISEHLELTSEVSSVSKEVATIYMNSIQQQGQQQPQRPTVNETPSSQSESTVWLPIPSNSLERMNFERGIPRSRSSTPDVANKMGKPLTVATDFHGSSSPECGSISSTISLTATPTLSPCSKSSSLSPRFPVANITLDDQVSIKKPQRPPRNVDSTTCTYQAPPCQYDNVPRPPVYPQTAYDNVPTNSTGYDNAPPPHLHAWTHDCKIPCDASPAIVEPQSTILEKSHNNGVEISSFSGSGCLMPINEIKTKESLDRSIDLYAPIGPNKANLLRPSNASPAVSVKFSDAPPETLYLPVEAKLYTRMEKPFTSSGIGPESSVNTGQSLLCGPYDNVPVFKENANHKETSPDLPSLTTDRELDSIKLIEQTIQLIEQSSKDMEENIDALVRCSSRSSQRSGNAINAGINRPMTPPSLSKTTKKIPPPVSVKPKLLLMTKAPLAQPELDNLGNSADSVNFKTARSSEALTGRLANVDTSTVPRCYRRSSSNCRSFVSAEALNNLSDKVPLGASIIVSSNAASTAKRICTDREAQVGSGTASPACGGSVCSCSGGSQCSLVNPRGSGLVNNERGGSMPATCPIDEHSEWNQIEAIFKSCGTGMSRLSVFDREMQPTLVSYLKNNGVHAKDQEHVLPSCNSSFKFATIDEWLASFGMDKYKDLLVSNGFDRVEFLNITLDDNSLRSLGILDVVERDKFLDELRRLARLKISSAQSYRYVSDWLQAHGCQDYLGEFIRRGYDTMWKVVHSDIEDVHSAFGKIVPLGHRLRLIHSLRIRDNDSVSQKTGSSFDRRHAFPLVDVSGQDLKVESLGIFSAHYLGSTLVENVTGIEATRAAIIKLKKATKEITKVPQVTLEITWQRVNLYDSGTRGPLCEHAVQNIHCVCQDERDMNCFAYIIKDGNHHFCHVFSTLTADIAAELILTLGRAFEIAYQKAICNST